jgi:hypothetical protein
MTLPVKSLIFQIKKPKPSRKKGRSPFEVAGGALLVLPSLQISQILSVGVKTKPKPSPNKHLSLWALLETSPEIKKDCLRQKTCVVVFFAKILQSMTIYPQNSSKRTT